MTNRELNDKLNYNGMERAIRKLAIKNHPDISEDIAVMSCLDVCDLICKDRYEILYAESEEIGLAKREDSPAIKKMLEVIGR